MNPSDNNFEDRVLSIMDSRLKPSRHENDDHLDKALLVQKLKPGSAGQVIGSSDGKNAIWSSLAGLGLLTNTALTGVPTAPTAAAGTNTTQVATTAYGMLMAAESVAAMYPGQEGVVTTNSTPWINKTDGTDTGSGIPGEYAMTAGGAALQVVVAAGRVLAKTTTGEVAYARTTASTTITVTTANATNPRIDRVVVDSSGVVSVVAGTPTVGATLTNETGIAAEPSNSITVGAILVPALFASTFTPATHFKDKRKICVSPGAVVAVAYRSTFLNIVTANTDEKITNADIVNLISPCTGVILNGACTRQRMGTAAAATDNCRLGIWEGTAIAGGTKLMEHFSTSGVASSYVGGHAPKYHYAPWDGTKSFFLAHLISEVTGTRATEAPIYLEAIAR